jgi:hypothetical protein
MEECMTIEAGRLSLCQMRGLTLSNKKSEKEVLHDHEVQLRRIGYNEE